MKEYDESIENKKLDHVLIPIQFATEEVAKAKIMLDKLKSSPTSVTIKRSDGLYDHKSKLRVAVAIAGILRGQIVQIVWMKLGQLQKDMAVKLILEYLEGAEFANSMDAIIQESIIVYDELKDEVKKHIARWKKRYLSYKTIYGEAATVKGKSKALMSGEPVPAQKISLPEPAEL